MTRPALASPVLLDTSTWSRLQDGQAPDIEHRLRVLGESGAVVFIVPLEAAIEAAGCRLGAKDRLAFMREFPGAAYPETTAHDLRQQDVSNLLRHVAGHPPVVKPIALRPLSELSISEHLLSGLKTASDLVAAHEAPAQLARASDRETDRAKLDTRYRRISDILHGIDSVEGLSADVLNTTGLPDRDQLRRLMTDMRAMPERGKPFDPIWMELVVPALARLGAPEDVLALVRPVWRHPDRRAQLAPCLAASAAVIERTVRNPRANYKKSELFDRDLAAYLPLVRVLCCDKRNRDPLRRVVRAGGLAVEVHRGDHLDSIARAAENWGDRGQP